MLLLTHCAAKLFTDHRRLLGEWRLDFVGQWFATWPAAQEPLRKGASLNLLLLSAGLTCYGTSVSGYTGFLQPYQTCCASSHWQMCVQSVIDLRETKHSSVLETQEAKQMQRVLGFLSKVMDVVSLPRMYRHQSICLCGHCQFCLEMQLSRSALTFIAQKTSAQPQPCKRCSQRLRNKRSGDSINVYHGEPYIAAKRFWHLPAAHAARHFPALHMSLYMSSQFECTGPRKCYVNLKHGVNVPSCSSWHH